MTKKKIVTAALAAGLIALGASGANAADLPSRKPVEAYVPPPAFTWTGVYVGVNLGGGFTSSNGLTGASNWFSGGNGQTGGIVGGAQIGVNYQIAPQFVIGAETDFQGTSIGSQNNGWFNASSKLPWFGTVRGRVGLALADSRLLVYGTGGLAYGQVKNDWLGSSGTRTGWTAGGGAEYAFSPNWSVKAEYLYTALSANNGNNWNYLLTSNSRAKFHTIRVGVNYRFNFPSSGAVVARY